MSEGLMTDGSSAMTPGKWIGLVAGPLFAVGVYLLLRHGAAGPGNVSGLSDAACAVVAVATLMAVWWLSEAIPLAATALLPIALFPVLNVMPIKQAAAPYGDDIVFLFLGGFFIQLAMERWGLHRRIALVVMLSVGSRPASLIAGLMLATAFISMWVSNAATAAMMLPIGISVAQLLARRHGVELDATRPAVTDAERAARAFAAAAMIAIAWSATWGGLATPIGTAPNTLLIGALKDRFGPGAVPSFAQWMLISTPIVLAFMALGWLLLTRVFFTMHFPHDRPGAPGAASGTADAHLLLRGELAALGPISRGELLTAIVFVSTALAWIFRPQVCHALGLFTLNAAGNPVYWLQDAGVAIIAGLVLFLVPVSVKRGEFLLDWKQASRAPLGVLLLFGGGLSLANAIEVTKVDDAIAGIFTALGGAGLAAWGPLGVLAVLAIIALVCSFFSELVSNTALASAMLPIIAAAAPALGVPPVLAMLAMTYAASAAHMLPAGTPPAAICFSPGYFTIRQMAVPGLILNLAGVLIIATVIALLGPRVLPGA